MSDIYPITLTRYNDLDEAGLIDANQTYQIYSTEEDIAQELIRTRKALEIAVDALEMIDSGKILEHSVFGHENETKTKIAHSALEQITALEQKE